MIKAIWFFAALSFFVSIPSFGCGGCSGKKIALGSGGVATGPGAPVSTTSGNSGQAPQTIKASAVPFSQGFFNTSKSEPGMPSTDENYSTAIGE